MSSKKAIGMFLVFLFLPLLTQGVLLYRITQKDIITQIGEQMAFSQLKSEFNLSEDYENMGEIQEGVCQQYGNESEQCLGINIIKEKISAEISDIYDKPIIHGKSIEDINHITMQTVLLSILLTLIGLIFLYKGSGSASAFFKSLSHILVIISIFTVIPVFIMRGLRFGPIVFSEVQFIENIMSYEIKLAIGTISIAIVFYVFSRFKKSGL
ncbi:MAG: hypothetical protein B6U68_02870 [Candidatus Aenigmarchaeota archaeon ex4484_14]|nr:MAG: hypothetical protein B6U68_02870 [Candidatus Aenigmarchaeota archaeon ex4484_14]